MTTYNKIIKLFLAPIIAVLVCTAVTGCKDDEGLQGSEYGYVQFKLYKAASYQPAEETPASRAASKMLSDIQKVEVELNYNGTSITQTLVLNSYSSENAEYGMRSDKLQLMAGTYTMVGYRLLDKVDEVVSSYNASGDIEVRPGELTVHDLTAEVQERGQVQFKLMKSWVSDSRASTPSEETYLFSDIDMVDITLRNTFTQATVELEKIPVRQELNYSDSEQGDVPSETGDKYYSSEIAYTDSLVWVPAGEYQVVEYSTYRKSGAVTYNLEIGTGVEGTAFTVEDNQVTKDAEVPVLLSETSEKIKDYMALYEIWKALNGPEWNYVGEAYPAGANWNFNKEKDMWGVQPGVQLDDNGRVTALTIAGFGAKGVVPDAIGQLTELRILAFGAHDEKLGGNITASLRADMSEADKKKVRENYANLFLKKDSREDLSEMLQWVINRDPKQKAIKKSTRISPKDVQIGAVTNEITEISMAVMRLTKLQNLFIANSTITADKVFTDWVSNPVEGVTTRDYKEEWKDEVSGWKWENFKDLTDMELYNCKNFDKIPDFVLQLPELQVLNLACNRGMKMKEQWIRLVTGSTSGDGTGTPTTVASKIQMLYLGYNDFGDEENNFPPLKVLSHMKNLHMLDCTSSGVKGKVEGFGSDVVLSQLLLSDNEITEIGGEFCSFSNDVETLNFANNKIKLIPNIFDASSLYVMGGVDFSGNQITGVADPDNFKGINASSVNLSNNKLVKFPKELFQAESPITTLNLAGNGIEKIEEGDIVNNRAGGRNKNANLISTIDLRFNKLSSLPDDFRATGIPYLRGFDVSYNCFSKVPEQPLNCSELEAIGVRHQRDAKGRRILRDWPVGITECPSLLQLQIGSNDIRKVDEEMTPQLWIVEVKDNPSITLDVTSVCSYISAGLWMLIYDKTQDIRGCDALDIEN